MTIDILKTTQDERNRNSVLSNSRVSPFTSVRRSLFGKVDHKESMDFLNKEIDAITEKTVKRWNFDFVNERPLNEDSGDYEWTPVHPQEIIPRAYAFSRLPYLSENSEISTFVPNTLCSKKSVCRTEVGVQSRLQDQEVTVRKPKLTQASINEFMKTKKRFSCCANDKQVTSIKSTTINYVDKSKECNQCCYPPDVYGPTSKKLRLSPCSDKEM